MQRLLDLQSDYLSGNAQGVVELALQSDNVRDLLVAVAQSADYPRIGVLLADRVIAAALPLFVARNLRPYIGRVTVSYDIVQDADAIDRVHVVYTLSNYGSSVSADIAIGRHDLPEYRLNTSRYREDNVGVVSSGVRLNRTLTDYVAQEHIAATIDGADLADCECVVCKGAQRDRDHYAAAQERRADLIRAARQAEYAAQEEWDFSND